MEFREGDREHVVEVEVLFDGVREMREAFTLHLRPDENMVAETQVRDGPIEAPPGHPAPGRGPRVGFSSRSYEHHGVVHTPKPLCVGHQVTKVIVYIEESNSMADVTFPSLPLVLSLLHYDHVARTPGKLRPPAGYPVVCVTVSP